MARTYGADLRGRVVAAVEGGLSRRAAAERFKVGVSTAIKWVRAWRDHGRSVAKPKKKSRQFLPNLPTPKRKGDNHEI